MGALQVKKFLLVVQLLLGEVPERSVFRLEGFQLHLKPYLALTQVCPRAPGQGGWSVYVTPLCVAVRACMTRPCPFFVRVFAR